MNIQQYKIFDKQGNYLNWTPEPFFNLQFNSLTGVNASGFLITDPSGHVSKTKLINGGYYYTETDTVSYTSIFNDSPVLISDASIILTDVSIYTSTALNTKTISDVVVDISLNDFIYPGATYAAAVFLQPVSQGLVETEHLYIFEETSTGELIRPYDDSSNHTLILKMLGDDDEIKFFTINEDSAEITWSNELQFDVSLYTVNVPLSINIGFKSENAGVFERTIRIYHLVGEELYTLADIVVNAEAIGEDERFRSLISNFGLPDPKDFPKLFKEVDINEDLPDWEILNTKSKHIILEHDKIMPYVGTYKALINALKWLGYDDIYIREWFKNVKDNTKLSLLVPFEASDRTQTILMLSLDQRKHLKKLNQLSLIYCLTRETDELDEWGTPITENCYTYNIKEVFVKLLALKNWLERYIVGVNCRITDITGEGIYIERMQSTLYVTDNIGYNYNASQSLTPYSLYNNSELIEGDSSIYLSFLELSETTLADYDYKFSDLVDYVWDPLNPTKYITTEDPSYLSNPNNYLLVGASFKYPSLNITDILWRLSVQKENGVIGNNLVTNPLFIYENDLRFYNIYDSSSVFYDVSTHLNIYLQEAYLRDPSIDEWTNSIAYTIYADPCDNGSYIMESSLGDITTFNGWPVYRPDTNSKLQYAFDDNYKVPLLSFKNYKYTDASYITRTFSKEYYLDILDGNISMNAGTVLNSSDNCMTYINFNYDTSLDEQQITMNVVYQSPRMKLYDFDPSIYYWADPSGLTGGNSTSYITDNSVYCMKVNHIGDYNIELFAWDNYNTIFYNPSQRQHKVWLKYPNIYALIDNECNDMCSSTYMSMADVSTLVLQNQYPIYDRYIPLQGISVDFDESFNSVVNVPSITYFQDVPSANSFNKFYNLTERVISIAGDDIVVDEDYQTFNIGDTVNLVKIDKGNYSLNSEAITTIINKVGTTLTVDSMPALITLDSSSEIYILNDTRRTTENVNNINNILVLDVSGYVFEATQNVAILVADNVTNYTWGATYKVSSVDGSTHTFNKMLPQFFIDNPSRYTITAKHAFSAYTEITAKTLTATEQNNVFKIYLDESNCQDQFLDNTFKIINFEFDPEPVNENWYKISNPLINSDFYYHKTVTVDTSTLVILRSIYDNSTYMLNQKNIWTVRDNITGDLVFKVFNDSVPYIFNKSINYDIEVESYDIYGNLVKTK